MAGENIDVGNWNLYAMEDQNGHLNVYVVHNECDKAYETVTGRCVNEGNGEQYAVRFITDNTEEDE